MWINKGVQVTEINEIHTANWRVEDAQGKVAEKQSYSAARNIARRNVSQTGRKTFLLRVVSVFHAEDEGKAKTK